MGVFNDIQNALNSRLSTLPELPDVAWPNVQYVPQQGTTYLRPTLLPAKGETLDLIIATKNTGIYQIDIYTPLKQGTSPLLNIADNIRNYFLNQRIIFSGTNFINVLSNISISKATTDNGWWTCFVEINYQCYTSS